MEKELQQLNLLSQAIRIPFAIFEGNHLISQAENCRWDYNLPLYLVSSLPQDLPAIWYAQCPERLYFGGIALPAGARESQGQAKPSRILFAGPVLSDTCTRKQASALMARLGRPDSDSDLFLQHTSRFPAVSVVQLCAVLKLLSASVSSVPAPEVPMIDFHWSSFFPIPETRIRELESSVYSGEEMENTLISMVRHGRVRDLQRFFNESTEYNAPELQELNPDMELRRSYMLGANMIASRSAASAGADLALINEMSGFYINELLKAKRIYELGPIFQSFMLDYASEAAKISSFPYDHDWVCHQVNRYVISHIYEKLSTAVIADSIHLSASYVSKRFRDVSGQTVTDFISEKKIKEAAYLIDTRQYTLGEISSLLQFSSQSYFTKIFKKYSGMTPEDYRVRSR